MNDEWEDEEDEENDDDENFNLIDQDRLRDNDNGGKELRILVQNACLEWFFSNNYDL